MSVLFMVLILSIQIVKILIMASKFVNSHKYIWGFFIIFSMH